MPQKIVLDNGVRVVTETIPYFRSVSIGLISECGSRNETAEESGACHFIEHMFFKGTAARSTEQLAREMSLVGGQFNAFTSHEMLCLHAKVADRHLHTAVELIADIFKNSQFDPGEIEREQNVILDEIKLSDDSPDDYVMELFVRHLWGEHALGRPIVGSRKTVSRLKREDLVGFIRREFSPESTVIAVAGNFDDAALHAQLSAEFSGLALPDRTRNVETPPLPVWITSGERRPLEQVHFCIGTLGHNHTSEERYGLSVLNAMLGATASSRLFQEIRERRGLVYNIGSQHMSFRDVGQFFIAGSTSPEEFMTVMDLVRHEIKRIYREDVSQDELTTAKEHLKSAFVLSLESTTSRMFQLADQEIYFGRFIPIEESLRRIDEIQARDVRALAEKYFKGRRAALATVGREVFNGRGDSDLTL
jgi:predicted Zn-dependent peptidase